MDIAKRAAYLEVDAGVRYWEDATVNDAEDEAGSLIPFRYGDRWKPVIRLADGVILDWPEGTTADVHYKVCDDGEYFLSDESLMHIAKYAGDYVPDDFLCHGDTGYGDYIIFKVGPSGAIEGWRRPTDFERWTAK